MKIEYQVCSFEQSKSLKDLGVTPQSYFVWVDDGNGSQPYVIPAENNIGDWHQMFYSAFTVAELGVMLGEGGGNISKLEKGYWHTEGIWGIHIVGTTEADCRAHLLIHLIENHDGFLSEVNARLSA